MALKTHPIHRSNKQVIGLDLLVKNKVFNFPDKFATERDAQGRLAIFISANGKNSYIPTGINTEISFQEFAILNDSHIMDNINSYEVI